MLEATSSVSLKKLPMGASADPLASIMRNIEKLELPVRLIDRDTLVYESKGPSLSVSRMARTLRLFDSATIRRVPGQDRVEFTVSMKKLGSISLFIFIAASAFLCLVSQSGWGLLVGLVLSLFIFVGNYFYGIRSMKVFIRKSAAGKDMMLF